MNFLLHTVWNIAYHDTQRQAWHVIICKQWRILNSILRDVNFFVETPVFIILFLYSDYSYILVHIQSTPPLIVNEITILLGFGF